MSVQAQVQHVDHCDQDEEEWTEIGALAAKGISATDIKKLKDFGLHTIADIQHSTTKSMLNIKGLSEAKVTKIKDVAKSESGNTFMSGLELREKRNAILKIDTGSADLNALLGGGVETSCITEVFGEFRTGKSQLSHTLSVTTQLPPERGGANGKVLVVDTEGAFRPDRLVPIAERFDLEPEAVLDNVTYVRAYTSEHQMELLREASGLLCEDCYKCMIIDSATSLFRVDYTGRGELASRQQALNHYLAVLTRMSTIYNIAIFITNQVTADPGASAMFGPVSKPIGGHVLAHASTVRILLKKGRGEQRIAKIYDSPDMPEADCTFAITNGGVANADE